MRAAEGISRGSLSPRTRRCHCFVVMPLLAPVGHLVTAIGGFARETAISRTFHLLVSTAADHLLIEHVR